MYETDVYKLGLLSEPPFVQKPRIEVLKMVNWRTRRVERRAAAPDLHLLALARLIDRVYRPVSWFPSQ